MLYPENREQVQAIIREARGAKTPLVPVSSEPPHLHGGSENETATAVNFSRMKKILKIDTRERYARIEPGVTFWELIPEMKKHGLRLNIPFLPRSKKSVIASMLEREPVLIPKYQYDYTDPLLTMEVVFGTGDDFRTGSAAGPGPFEESKADMVNPWGPGSVDYMRFISGAQGTMGFVTWATLKAEILPKMSRLYFITAEDSGKLTALGGLLLKKRVLDECLILNAVNLAAALTGSGTDADVLRGQLAPWTMVCRICGFDRYPEERIEIQEGYLNDACAESGLRALRSLAGAEGYEQRMEDRLTGCDAGDTYWKHLHGGGLRELFFLAPPSRVPGLIGVMNAESEGNRPLERIGVTLQPQVQGRAFHVGFDLYYEKQNSKEAALVDALFEKASRVLFESGAYFSRPYGSWAGMVFEKSPESVRALRTIKGIFDPDGILNPGKLCF